MITVHPTVKIPDYSSITFVELHEREDLRGNYGSQEHQTRAVENGRGVPSISPLRYQSIGVRLNLVRIRAGQNSSSPSIFGGACSPANSHGSWLLTTSLLSSLRNWRWSTSKLEAWSVLPYSCLCKRGYYGSSSIIAMQI